MILYCVDIFVLDSLILCSLAGKTLTDFSNLFVPNNYQNNDDIILKYFMANAEKIVECNSHETHNIYSNLNDQQNLELIKSMKLNIILLPKLKKEN